MPSRAWCVCDVRCGDGCDVAERTKESGTSLRVYRSGRLLPFSADALNNATALYSAGEIAWHD